MVSPGIRKTQVLMLALPGSYVTFGLITLKLKSAAAEWGSLQYPGLLGPQEDERSCEVFDPVPGTGRVTAQVTAVCLILVTAESLPLMISTFT